MCRRGCKLKIGLCNLYGEDFILGMVPEACMLMFLKQNGIILYACSIFKFVLRTFRLHGGVQA